MAAGSRLDDQGNLIQVEGEGEEGEFQDAEGRGMGDERGQGVPDPQDPRNPRHRGAHGWGDPDLGYDVHHG